MHLSVIGLNNRTAPVAVRERLAKQAERLTAKSGLSVLQGREMPGELVVLSTCNRFEMYLATSQSSGARAAMHAMLDLGEQGWLEVAPCLYEYQHGGAARHLFRVACGLDSAILGDSQILSQVTQAYRSAAEAGMAGPLLARLFQQAACVGKRARAETAIGSGTVSVASAAVHLLRDLLPELRDKRVLVVGAGTVGRMAAQCLRKLEVANLAIVNRSLERGQSLATEIGAEAEGWDALSARLTWADAVVVATSASQIVSYRELERVMEERRAGGPLTIVDVGVPRNVAPRAASISGLHLLDIDALTDRIEEGKCIRQNAVPQVEALIDEAVDAFTRWYQSRAVAPTIAALCASLEELRQREMGHAFKHMGNLSQAERQAVDDLTRSLVDKLLQPPIKRLKAAAAGGDGCLYERVVQELFALEELEPGRLVGGSTPDAALKKSIGGSAG